MKSEADVAAIVAQFERRYQLASLTVRGIAVWRLLRNPVCMALQTSEFSGRSLPRGERLLAVLRSIWDLAILPSGLRYAIKTSISAMRIHGKNGYEDIYFEQLINQEPGGVRLHTLNAPGYIWRKSATPAPSVDCSAIPVFGAIMARLFPIDEGDEVYAQLSALIDSQLGLSFPSKKIQLMFSSLWWQSHAYEWLLCRLGVRTVFVAETDERALLIASRRLAIRFIELQHGVFTPDHPDALPSTLANAADVAPLLLPDTLALYGTYWVERLSNTMMGRLGRLCCVGASVIERYRLSRVLKPSARTTVPQLLVTTQGVSREALIKFLCHFLDLYVEPCLIIVKLHPAFDTSTLPYAVAMGKDRRVKIIRGSDDPNTYELMANSDLHISIASACHYDALGIGVPTLVLGLPGWTLMKDLIQSGDALFAEDPEELVTIVKEQLWRSIEPTVSEKYYRAGFAGNLLSLIA